MRRGALEINFQKMLVLALALLLCACGKKKDVVYGTIADVNAAGSQGMAVATDNIGNEIQTARSIDGTYPDLELYTGKDIYEDIYVPVLGKSFSSDRFILVEHNAEYVMMADREHPNATYTFGRISDIHPEKNEDKVTDEYALFSYIYPLTEFAAYVGNTYTVSQLYHSEVTDMQEDWIGDISANGYRFTAVTGVRDDPRYLYLICTKDGNDGMFALMATDEVDENGKIQVPLALEHGKDGRQNITSMAKEATKTEYKVYRDMYSMAVPEYMEVETLADGIRVRERADEATPFAGAGARVIRVEGDISTKDEAELLKTELNSLAHADYRYDVTSVQYEEHVEFLGVSDATHLYGTMRCTDAGLDMRKSVCGTGEICYDIYKVSRNGQKLVIMFYRGEAQNGEFTDFIRFNTY